MTRDEVDYLLDRAQWLSEQNRGDVAHILAGKILGILFYQNSTRTRLGFETAMQRLGGSVIGFDDVRTTRAGDYFAESLIDTVRVVAQYADCLVLRHPEDHAAVRAAQVSLVPVINAGDGANEHPTQALLDMGMLRRLLGDALDGATIGLVGDPNWRPLRSLRQLLPLYGVDKIFFLAAPDTNVGADTAKALVRSGVAWEESDDISQLLQYCDAICMVPVLLPTTSDGVHQPPLPNRYRLTRQKLLRSARPVPILHVGPRGSELPADVDDMDCVHYFDQVRFGVYLRAALLEHLIVGPSQ